MRSPRLISRLPHQAPLLLAPATPPLATHDDRAADRHHQREHPGRIHPAVQQVIAMNLASVVDVILPKRTPGSKPESRAHQEACLILRPLPPINGSAVRLPARAVEEITDEDGARAVSPHAPLRVEAIAVGRNDLPAPPSGWHVRGFSGRGIAAAMHDTAVDPALDRQGRTAAGIDLAGRTGSGPDVHGEPAPVAGDHAGHGAASGGRYPGVGVRATLYPPVSDPLAGPICETTATWTAATWTSATWTSSSLDLD